MPRSSIDYTKSLLYNIVCRNIAITECYVGCTTDFIRRRACHKHRYNSTREAQGKPYLYRFIQNNGGWNNFTMILIKTIPCDNSLEAHKLERENV